MNCKKMWCMLCCILLTQTALLAQDKAPVKFGKVTKEDFEIKSSLLDSNTNAIVVADVGVTDFMANTYELSFSLLFKHQKRIKLINKNGFDAATVVIPLYVGKSGDAEELQSLKAYTYNLENDKVVETKVDKGSIFSEKHNKNWIYKKFTFPAIKDGSIIEFSYEIKSNYFFNLQPWEFQGQYPVLWSQYKINVPDFFKYVTISQGYQPFYINNTTSSAVKYNFIEHTQEVASGAITTKNSFDVAGQLLAHNWVMKDVPALKEESYTTTINNHIAKIEFQLNQIAYPNTFPKDFSSDWSKVGKELLEDDNFGIPIKRANNWMDDITRDIVAKDALPEVKAKKIFEFVRDNFVCKKQNTFLISSNLKDVYKNKSGNVADLNMFLIALLRNVNIEADPVILSTRDFGVTHELYPLMERFNYVIAQVTIDSKVFYLDATEPRLAFGRISPQCYNGHARVINENVDAVYFYADSLKEKSTVTVFVSNDENGDVSGAVNSNPGYYESLSIRNKLAKTTIEDFNKSIKEQYPDEVEVSKIVIDSLKMLDFPISINVDFKLKSFDGTDMVYFNPIMDDVFKKNPFSSAVRFYPVEMPYVRDENYSLNMEIPKGYEVEELPKSVRILLNESDGMFEYLISSSGGYIQMRSRLVFYKANFPNEDYQNLRDFFGYVVKKQAEQIVFKKIKK